MAKKRRKYKKKDHMPLLIRGCMTLLAFVLGYGGLDYYTNRNLERTFGLLSRFSQILSGDEHLQSYSTLADVPEYSGDPYVVINENQPEFGWEVFDASPYESYSPLDLLGRCGTAEALISRELMPTEVRGEIGMIKPSGWHTVKYDSIEDRYLFNRCHLIAFELTGENANEKNLITGTRYMNVTGMLPWENRIAQYIRRTHDQVFYRVTPIFRGYNLVADGVHMEAQSRSSNEIHFNIFVYNVQPGIKINYADGSSAQE